MCPLSRLFYLFAILNFLSYARADDDPVSHDLCDYNPCYNGGTCDLVGPHKTVRCECPPGFTGPICFDAITSDATVASMTTAALALSGRCFINVCQNGGSCVVNKGVYHCACTSDYTGTVCHDPKSPAPTMPTTTKAPRTTRRPKTTTTVAATTKKPTLANTLGPEACGLTEVVFLVAQEEEDRRKRAPEDRRKRAHIDHHMDFIRNLVNGWHIGPTEVRVGVVTYGDGEDGDANRFMRLEDSKKDVIHRLEKLSMDNTGGVSSGMSYARTHLFQNSRANANKIAVLIVPKLSRDDRRSLTAQAKLLKDQGVTLYGIVVGDDPQTSIKDIVDHYFYLNHWSSLDHVIPAVNYNPCSN